MKLQQQGIHFPIDRDHRACCSKAGPIGILNSALRHWRLRAPVDKGLAAVPHHHALPAEQHHIFVLLTLVHCKGCNKPKMIDMNKAVKVNLCHEKLS